MGSSKRRMISKRERVLIVLLFSALAAAGFIKLGGLSYFRALEALDSERREIAALLAESNKLLATADTIENKWAAVKTDSERLAALIPEMAMQPSALGNLERLLRSSAGTLASLRVEEKISYGDYCALQVNATISDLPALPELLLKRLENFPHLLLIEQLVWEQDGEGAGVLHLQLNLFFLE